MDLSPMTIYWVMMIDSIKVGVERFGDVFKYCGGSIFCLFIVLWMFSCADDLPETFTQHRRKFLLLAVSCFCFFSIGFIFKPMACFIPNRKTICAMYAIPKIANSDTLNETLKTVSKDTKDIYKIGIEAIKSKLEVKETK